MAFPDDLWIASSYSGNIYHYEKDSIVGNPIVVGDNKPQGVLVSQDGRTIYTANRENSKISIIRDGMYDGDVTVGAQPYCMCEDPYGILYVTCYKDNMVYKIEKDISDITKITAMIPVDLGPAGIISDSDGTIWVACSNSGTVCKIVNETVVQRIETGKSNVSRPTGITCDTVDNIWVANYSSNTIVKINRSQKILTLDIPGAPIDVVCDKNNNIFVACYLGDKIVQISPKDYSRTEIALPNDSGVTALSINSENDVYAVATLANKIYKIHKKALFKIIETPFATPVGFGDFTGCEAYNVFSTNVSGGGSSGGGSITTPDEAAVRRMAAIKATFTVANIKEDNANNTTTFYITSKVMDLASFDHIKLNGVVGNYNVKSDLAMFTLSNTPTIRILNMTGYFDADEKLPIPFVPQNYDSIFQIITGVLTDDGTGTYTFTPTVIPYKVVNVDDEVNTMALEPTVDGNLAILIPERVAPQIETGLVVGGMQIYEDWVPDSSILPDIQAALTDYPNYRVYMNQYESYAGNTVILNRYKL